MPFKIQEIAVIIAEYHETTPETLTRGRVFYFTQNLLSFLK